MITDAKYGFIAGALKETFQQNVQKRIGKTRSENIDTFLTHKLLGFPIFLLFLWVMFQSTFVIGEYPKHWIDLIVGWIGSKVSLLMPDGPFKDLLVDGIISGVGSVIVFLPNILILFLFISLMEDTGYMARAAFIMDKLMHKIGLHGQSFIPLIMGFGCNVPAIMVTRTLKDRNDRLLTMLINPFMSCSARLPVYILIAGAIFPKFAGTVIFGLYLTGITLAILMALVFKKILFRQKEAPFVMELPPYRIPTGESHFQAYVGQRPAVPEENGRRDPDSRDPDLGTGIFSRRWKNLKTRMKDLQNSYIAKIGKTIEPVIKPLGFDWKMGVSLITGAAAKEVVVSTMGVLYDSGHYPEREAQKNLQYLLANEKHLDGPKERRNSFSHRLQGISFLLFILVYMPCIAVVATVRRESGTWKWALFLITYTTLLAWVLSFSVYQIGSMIIQ